MAPAGRRGRRHPVLRLPDWVLGWWETLGAGTEAEVAACGGRRGSLRRGRPGQGGPAPPPRVALTVTAWTNLGGGRGAADDCGWPVRPDRASKVRDWLAAKAAGRRGCSASRPGDGAPLGRPWGQAGGQLGVPAPRHPGRRPALAVLVQLPQVAPGLRTQAGAPRRQVPLGRLPGDDRRAAGDPVPPARAALERQRAGDQLRPLPGRAAPAADRQGRAGPRAGHGPGRAGRPGRGRAVRLLLGGGVRLLPDRLGAGVGRRQPGHGAGRRGHPAGRAGRGAGVDFLGAPRPTSTASAPPTGSTGPGWSPPAWAVGSSTSGTAWPSGAPGPGRRRRASGRPRGRR